MSKFAKFGLGAALAMGLALPVLAEDAAPAPTADTVVATVNGHDITLGDMIVLRSQLPAQYQAVPNDKLFPVILEQLIQQQALADTISDKLSKHDQIAMQNNARAYVAGVAIDGIAAAAVTDEALKAAYDAQYANFQPATEYHARHILVKTEEEAKDLKAQIDAGADFAELAKAHSTDGSAAQGGDLGWFGLGMMVQPFEDAVKVLKPGEVSGPVQTQFGWHLVKLEETRPTKAPTLDEVKDDLSKQVQQTAVLAAIDSVAKAATVVKHDEGIDPKLLSDESLLGN